MLDLLPIPEGREQLHDLLFNFDGRISRAGYWRACIAWVILLLLLLFVMIVLGSLMPYLAVCVALIADRRGTRMTTIHALNCSIPGWA